MINVTSFNFEWCTFQQRKTLFKVAKKCCEEIAYKLHDKEYFGISHKNDFGDYKIRSLILNTCNSPKDVTALNSNAKEAFDF